MNEQVRAEVVALARILTDPDVTKAALDARVACLEGDELPKVVIRAREVLSLAKHVIDVGEAEMALRAAAKARGEAGVRADAVVAPGGEWIDKGTGVLHRFVGELSPWKVADPRGLRLAMAAVLRPDGSRFLTDAEIERAVPASYKPDHRVLNEFERIDPALAIVIGDFRKKDRGPAHLKEDAP